MMDKPPAPENLLKIIKCNCQSDCVTRACSCRKHQLKCSIVCGNCKGTACLNAMEVESEDNQNIGEDELRLKIKGISLIPETKTEYLFCSNH